MRDIIRGSSILETTDSLYQRYSASRYVKYMIDSRPSVSIIIVTKNRPGHIYACLAAIMRGSVLPFEIIVADQSFHSNTEIIVHRFKSNRIRHFRLSLQGKSRGLNFAIKKAQGDIFAYTDDDCIVGKSWIDEISKSFEKYPSIIGVLGSTHPYQPHRHPSQMCPAVFRQKIERIVRYPLFHAEHLGYGNNMAFRKAHMSAVGPFKTWLGPGAPGFAAEDAEFMLRSLMRKYSILLNPKMIVAHDRWLSRRDYFHQSARYTCGEVACYTALAFSGWRGAREVVQSNFRDSLIKIRKMFTRTHDPTFVRISILQEFFYRLRGLIIGSTFFLLDGARSRFTHANNKATFP